MRKLISHMQVTLDGFMSGPNGELEWSGAHHDDAMWQDVFDIMSTVDTALFGRVTYQLFEDYWPGAARNPASSKQDIEFAKWIDKIPKIVVSTTLKTVAWNNSRLIKDNIADEIGRLKQQAGRNLLMFGSSSLASTLLKLELIDEFRVNVHPVVLGRGKTLFHDLSDTRQLDLVGAKKINSAVVGLHYQKAGS